MQRHIRKGMLKAKRMFGKVPGCLKGSQATLVKIKLGLEMVVICSASAG